MSYSESSKKATAKYKAREYKRIPLDVRVSEYNEIADHCSKAGKTVNGYIRQLIKSDLSSDDPRLSELLPGKLYTEFVKTITRENAELSTFFINPIKKYIDKHKQPED